VNPGEQTVTVGRRRHHFTYECSFEEGFQSSIYKSTSSCSLGIYNVKLLKVAPSIVNE
jgi:hypothetical protein